MKIFGVWGFSSCFAIATIACGGGVGGEIDAPPTNTISRALVTTELLASDGQALQFFGGSVSVSGSWAIMGAAGSAYIFFNHPTTGWTQHTKLTLSGVDGFGGSVGITTGAAVVTSNRGAEVFRYGSGVWSYRTTLDSGVGVGPVAIDGNTIVMGTPHDGEGSAHVWRLINGAWTYEARLESNEPPWILPAVFGSAVSVSGNSVLIGSYGNMELGYFVGAAFVYVRGSSGGWTLQTKLYPQDWITEDLFGASVSISGDTAVVTKGLFINGTAQVHVRSGTTWTYQATLGTESSAHSIAAVQGNDIIVAASVWDPSFEFMNENVFLYRYLGGQWVLRETMVRGPDSGPNDCFGCSVAVSNHTAFAGAPRHDHGAGFLSGSVYTFSSW